MTAFIIVKADTPEPAAVEKPVQFKMELCDTGLLIFARQDEGWVKLVYVQRTCPSIHRWMLNRLECDSLPGLTFDDDNLRKWSVN